ncbi:hypothetical protein HLB23_35340 [Nocardia uniformis]|uniref:Inhibitor I9 domain-containing protein n=1 Tax=Nocardia uniformis TaxID=53432 RepID=A0A849CF45_9NOCA|nr:protease inhibitor I9 family protein [Nocardia uniformis]NNH75067.1 hypothetical protein [Nocardia uniformis]
MSKKRLVGALGAILLLTLAGQSGPAQADKPEVQIDKGLEGKAVPGQYIVTLTDGVPIDTVLDDANVKKVLHRYTNAINGFAAQLSAGQLKKLQQDERVEMIDEDVIGTKSAIQENPQSTSRAITTSSPISSAA